MKAWRIVVAGLAYCLLLVPAAEAAPASRPRAHSRPPARARVAPCPGADTAGIQQDPCSVSPGLRARPHTLEIRTLPSRAGIRFLLEGVQFESNEQGVARLHVWQDGSYRLELLPPTPSAGHRRLEFARWEDAVFTRQRQVEITSSVSLAVGFDVIRPIQLQFVDLEGNPVPGDRVERVELRNSIGDVYTFPGDEQPWLQASQVLGRDLGLDLADVVYTVQRAFVDGSSVVNRGQQRFVISSEEPPPVELLLYPVRFSARDALFGFPLGRRLRLRFPDGHSEVYPLDSDGRLALDNLARGTYRATVEGTPGLAPPAIFVLSRDQVVQPIVISLVDLALALVLAIAVFPGLLLAGRPQLRADLRRRWPGRRREDDRGEQGSRQ